MTDECISLLRQRMIEDMSLRNFGEKTQKDYIRAVKNLTTDPRRYWRIWPATPTASPSPTAG